MSFKELEKQIKLEKQINCKHLYLIGKSNGKYECCDCNKELENLPKNKKLMF